MKTKCPSCGFEGTIKDELIPDGGRNVGCPHCKASFLVKKGPSLPTPTPGPSVPDDLDITTGEFMLSDPRAPRGPRGEARRPSIGVLPLSALLILVLVVGFFIGRYTHDYTLTAPLKKVMGPAPGLPTPTATPTDAVVPRGESILFPESSTDSPPPGEVSSELPTEPLMDEESFTSDIYLDIVEVDAKLNEESTLTGIQRELELKEYGQGLVGKTLVGYFIVRDVGSVNSTFKGMLPLTLYRYYVEAEGQEDSSIKSVIYLGLKQIDDLSSSLEKGGKVYIKGFVYGCGLNGGRFEMGLANGTLESR